MVASLSDQLAGALPVPRSGLVGRELERATARAYLVDAAVAVLTLTGPGGVGKTRLALAVADDAADAFADGVIWVDLAPSCDPALVPAMVARALQLKLVPDRPVIDELAHWLRGRQMLLLLDNCEHLLAATAELVGILVAYCPAIQILATSRSPLRVRGEQVLPVEPLLPPAAAPATLDQLARNEAVRLFTERARQRLSSFTLTEANAASIAALCRALDGLPLALELAAARMTMLSPSAIISQVTDRLVLLSDGPRDAPVRQQTIAATIGWSYDLLPDAGQRLFRRLAVFRGGFTLDAAQAVAGTSEPDLPAIVRDLSSLVDQSLVQRQDGEDGPRFTLLETIRTFAADQLRASGEEPAIRERHRDWVVAFVTAREARVAAYLPQGSAILDQLEAEYASLDAALTWLRETGQVSALLSLAADLGDFWRLRGHLREGRQWLEWGLTHADAADALATARGSHALATLAHMQHESKLAVTLCEAALRTFRAAGDLQRIALVATEASRVAVQLDRPDLAEAYRREGSAALDALPAYPWTPHARSRVAVVPGVLAKNRGDTALAERLLGEIVAADRERARADGAEQAFTCWPLIAWGAVAHLTRDLPLALTRYQAALSQATRTQEARCRAYALTRVAGIVAMTGRWEEAAWLLGAAEAYAERIGLAWAIDVWALTRAFGVPHPWQGPEDYTGQERALRTTVRRRGYRPIAPIPDPERAAGIWAAGRQITIDTAISHALAVTLTGPAAMAPELAGSRSDPVTAHGLTPRQREILRLLCDRLTDAEIAERLSLSPRTVEGHVAQILSKLQVANRREAAALAAREHLMADQ